MDHPAKVNLNVRSLILDYALAAAIVALLPIPEVGLLKAIALLILNILLVIGIARLWRFHRGGDFLGRVGVLFGLAGSILMAAFAWLCVVALSVMTNFPSLMVLAAGVTAFFYFWGVGQTVHYFYLSKVLKSSAHTLSAGDSDYEA
ncbi:MAG: hypothetical protein MH252_18220 [Thermosynechococcaceae cyanobacterium MS004]|nr:hypothetical protein [Thermosynechococcaceae cyanobacterium MS004]